MLKRILVSVITLALVYTAGLAKEIAGVVMPESYTLGQDNLVLNGAGLREKFAIGVDVYVSGLYLKNKTNNALQIINAHESMVIRLCMVRNVNVQEFSENTLAGFQESAANLGIDIRSIDKEIKQFLEVFSGSISKNDVFDITWSKAGGVRVYKNFSKTPRVTIKNMTLKRALFGIWLTNRSEDKLNVLRRGMLGQ
ncbi:MAG TPA: chalcone isomerase family protein [Spirochaetota bacterium]|nr:chalcone isomerase family protein [Spirochaetota bacterium]